MKKISLILTVFLFSNSLFADYPLIQKPNDNLPKCKIENKLVLSKEHCFGKYLNFQVGDQTLSYEGEFKNGMFNGNGILDYGNNIKYYGGFENGEINGYGRLDWPTNNNYIYTGEHILSARQGKGSSINNDTKFVGNYSNNLRDGEGIIVNRDSGSIWKTFFENGKKTKDNKQATFLEYDSGIGMKFNHIGHLSFLPKKNYEELIKELPDWQSAINSNKPHIERVIFFDANGLNYISEEKNFHRLTVEYDFIEDEEAEMLFSTEGVYVGMFEDKYRFAFFDWSDFYENTIARVIIINVNDRYYTVSYFAPFNNEEERVMADNDFYYFFESMEFNVPENEVGSNIIENNIDKNKVNLFGIPVGVKIFNELNPTSKSYEEWVLEDYIDIYDSKAFEIKPLINNVNFDYYYARTTPVTDIIYFINAVDKNLLDKSECTLKQLTLRNALLDKYEKSNFDIKTHTVDLTEEIHLILNNEEKYSFYVNCFYRKINTDIGHQLGIKLMDHDYRNLLQSEYNDFLEIKAQNKEDKKRNIKSESVDTSGIL